MKKIKVRRNSDFDNSITFQKEMKEFFEARCKQLEAKCERYEKALEFYADTKTWFEFGEEALGDDGETAREALNDGKDNPDE